MHGAHIAPVLPQIFEHQAPVAVLRRRLTAQQHRRHSEEAPVDALLHAPLGQQRQKAALVRLPTAVALLVGVEELRRGREQRLMVVVRIADRAQKVHQVVALGEPRELRRVVQAHVYQSSDANSSERLEELLGGLLGETDRIDFHSSAPSGGSLAVGGAKRLSCVARGAGASNARASCSEPSPRMWRTSTPSPASTRAISSLRWQLVGSSSLHSIATRASAASSFSRSSPLRKNGASATLP